MSANNTPVKANNSIGGLLTTLASSGDNWVKVLIVGGLILNTVMTKHNGTGIKDNNRELDQLRVSVARQVKVIYDNQRAYADFMDETRAGVDRLQTQAGIPHPPSTPYPRQEMPDYIAPYTYP
jgi:hypothetical protein